MTSPKYQYDPSLKLPCVVCGSKNHPSRIMVSLSVYPPTNWFYAGAAEYSLCTIVIDDDHLGPFVCCSLFEDKYQTREEAEQDAASFTSERMQELCADLQKLMDAFKSETT